jgi:hypothetical protein
MAMHFVKVPVFYRLEVAFDVWTMLFKDFYTTQGFGQALDDLEAASEDM